MTCVFLSDGVSQTGDAIFYYQLDDFTIPNQPRVNTHIGVVHIKDGEEWILSKFGPEPGIYKHKAAGCLPWYGLVYVYRRPSDVAKAAYARRGP